MGLLILAILSGLLMAFSMPGADLGILAWIALIPLFFAIDEKSSKHAFKLAFLAGLIFGLVEFYWAYSLWDWISVGSLFVHVGLAIFFGLNWGIFAALCSLIQRKLVYLNGLMRTILMLISIPAIWVLLEYLRSLTAFGFPWAQIADAVYGLLPVIQIASLTGIWGVSYLIVFVSYALFLAYQNQSWRVATAALFVVGLVFIGGSWRLDSQPIEANSVVNLALLQPNVEQVIRSNPAYIGEFYQIYTEMLEEVSANSDPVDLVVIPESALPTYILSDSQARDFFDEWVQTNQIPILLGTFTWDEGQTFNSVASFAASGPDEQVYHKVQLVPFSTEFFPGIDWLNQMGLARVFPMAARLGGITPGEGFNALETEYGRIATPVCFETIFPHVSRQFSRDSEAIISVTNDAWFKNSWALPQHFAKGVFRAIENGRYFAQAANTGISGVVDPYGRIRARSSIEDRAVTYSSISMISGNTFFTDRGDWFIGVLAILLLFTFVSILLGARSRSQELSIE